MTVLVALFSLHANAYDAYIDGIYYNLISKANIAEVTNQGLDDTSIGYAGSYSGKITIPSTIKKDGIIYNVTSIGQKAFYKCKNLSSVSLPNSITTINDHAFWFCSKLTSIVIPNSVTSIGEWAFAGCDGLAFVTIPNSVTSIGAGTFSGCKNLASVAIGNSVTSIGMGAFNGCSSLTSVIIPNCVNTIGSEAFEDCSSLASINIPNSLESISRSTFYGCSSLTSMNIPNGVTKIYGSAFYGCSSLTSVTIPNSVTFVGDDAFYGCVKLEDVFCYSKDAILSNEAFRDSYIEHSILHVPFIAIENYKKTCGFGKIVAIDVKIDGVYYNLNSDELTAEVSYGDCAGNLTIPNSIKYDNKSFLVTCIVDNAFNGCNGLTSVTIPSSVTSIGASAFNGCGSLTSATISNGVTSIGASAFRGCGSLNSVTIPNSVTSIGASAFAYCSSLSSVTIPNSVTSINDEAFRGCSGLISVVMPNSITSIGNYAFSECGNLTSAAIPYSITSIGYRAFASCNGLTSMVIPNSITKISNDVFYKCTGLLSVTIPNSVTSIGASAFWGCSSLSSVTIPNSVTSIGNYAFGSCNSLISVSIPVSVKNIDYEAFSNCKNIRDVYSYPTRVPDTNSDIFRGVSTENATLHIPEVSIDSYKDKEPWCKFGKLEAIISPTYTLTYMVDGKVYKSIELEKNTSIVAETEPIKEGYTFSGWIGIPTTMPTYNVNVEGSFTINTYKLNYMVDDEIYKSYEIEYGGTITAEAEPSKEGYTFSGWSESPASMPAHDVTVIGTFKKDAYTLTYKVDGDIYKIFDLETGKEITPEAAPKKEGYTFSGWSEIPATMPEKNVTVTGSFTINKYTLTYEVDGETYKKFEVEYGANITAEAEPKKKGFTFSGWSEIPATMPAHDVTINGSYTPIIPVPSYKRHLSSQTTSASSIIIGSFVQKSVGFYLSNDGTESINVTKLVVKNPENNYSVVSTSTDASLLGQLDGGNSIALSVNLNADFTPCYEWHYTYKGKEFVFSSDVNDPAMKRDVTFYVDGLVYVTYEYDMGDEIIPEEEPTKEHYTFSGWSEIPATMPDKNVVVNGTFIGDKYTLTYIVDEETYKTYEVEYGTTITEEDAPTKEGYTFSGWNEVPETMPAKDVTVTGSFAINSYKLTYTVDGVEHKSSEVKYGATIAAEAEPTKEGYTFSGWSEIPETMPAKDVVITGSFSINSYKLIYIVDNEEYKVYDVEYGANITAEAAPIKDGYTFSGWSEIPETMPAKDVTITGCFTFVDAIEDVIADDGTYEIYTTDGKRIETLQKGVNIIKYRNGSTQKVYVK